VLLLRSFLVEKGDFPHLPGAYTILNGSLSAKTVAVEDSHEKERRRNDESPATGDCDVHRKCRTRRFAVETWRTALKRKSVCDLTRDNVRNGQRQQLQHPSSYHTYRISSYENLLPNEWREFNSFLDCSLRTDTVTDRTEDRHKKPPKWSIPWVSIVSSPNRPECWTNCNVSPCPEGIVTLNVPIHSWLTLYESVTTITTNINVTGTIRRSLTLVPSSSKMIVKNHASFYHDFWECKKTIMVPSHTSSS